MTDAGETPDRAQLSARPASAGPVGRPTALASVAEVAAGYRHVYISPHFDDVALSTGGTALLHARRGEPTLVVCVHTAQPPGALTDFAVYQHDRWGAAADPWRQRADEERAAMAALGADYLWLGHPDAIYRGGQYLSDEELFGPVKAGDEPQRRALLADTLAIARRCAEATLYLPMAVGGHVDHQLACDLAPALAARGARIVLYEDCPYALSPGAVAGRLRALAERGWRLRPELVEVGALLDAKVRAVELYGSQVPWIFRHFGPAAEVLAAYAASLSAGPGGRAERLWVLTGSAADSSADDSAEGRCL